MEGKVVKHKLGLLEKGARSLNDEANEGENVVWLQVSF